MIKGKALVNEWNSFLQTGNETAFYVIYEHYYDYLIYIGFQRQVSSQKVKDSINDLFLYIFENRSRLLHIGHHHNYLVTSFIRSLYKTKNTAVDTIELDEELVAKTLKFPSTETIYIQQNAEEELRAIVQNYISKLSDSQSRLIYQKFYIGLSYQEIAAANNISIKTAYNTILQALAKLKKIIPKEHLDIIANALVLLSSLLFLLMKH